MAPDPNTLMQKDRDTNGRRIVIQMVYTVVSYIATQLIQKQFWWGNNKISPLKIRKILVSVKFVSAILGPEMAALVLWTPGNMRSFCRKNLCP